MRVVPFREKHPLVTHLCQKRERRKVLEVLDQAHHHQPRHAQENHWRLLKGEQRVQVPVRIVHRQQQKNWAIGDHDGRGGSG